MKPVLVGEDNPNSSDPRHALYPRPKHLAGGRLCHRIMVVTEREYLRWFARANLCAGSWSAREARATASALLDRHEVHVILGAKVAHAYGLKFKPFEVVDAPTIALDGVNRWNRFVILPHPSGRCRTWNDPAAFDRAHEVLVRAGVISG